MPVFGSVVLALDESVPTPVDILDEHGEPSGAKFILNTLPRAKSEQLLRPVVQRTRRLDNQSSDEAMNKAETEVKKFKLESALLAIHDTVEVKVNMVGATAVEKYAKYFPGLKSGDCVALDGKWSEEFGRLFLADRPDIMELAIDAYRRMNTVKAEEKAAIDQGKGTASLDG